ncbi:hypothetical protein Q75_05080 [Bacillus coahuilensis p1.1.43]|uniref:RNA polymerase sigma-70 region 2 domain-containing protein n=1 Tax=Bacillus coahuilensis p1.1.43 TaxID=1150625 RepID=A0A147KA78_9BACI|nr:sigma-70 family RNA polymerase sigma factor [Bacillus coahuilensis]KUP07602.1 hypothetical protein Q75_05080 [Bacillus coahuilensis p1.1.43]
MNQNDFLFEKAVEKYSNMIFHVMKKLHVYQNREDYHQIGLTAIWKAMETYNQERGEFAPYLYVTMMGMMKTQIRRDIKEKEVENLVSPDEILEGSYDQHVLETELVEGYCAHLSPKEKLYIHYVFVEQLDHQTIAEKHKVSLSAVKNWKAGAFRKLRKELRQHSKS